MEKENADIKRYFVDIPKLGETFSDETGATWTVKGPAPAPYMVLGMEVPTVICEAKEDPAILRAHPGRPRIRRARFSALSVRQHQNNVLGH